MTRSAVVVMAANRARSVAIITGRLRRNSTHGPSGNAISAPAAGPIADNAATSARVDARGKDHEDLHYLVACDRAYRALPEASGFTVVDAAAHPATVQADLRRAVLAQPARHQPRAVHHLLPIG